MQTTTQKLCEFMSPGEFLRWLMGASPGARVTYFAGTPDVCLAGVRPAVGETARKASDDAHVDLFQRRRPEGGFEYIAVRRKGGPKVVH